MTKIYLITNKINNKKYVGKTKRSLKIRFRQHCLAYGHGIRTYIACAINKYGEENFTIEELATCKDDDFAYFESYYIQLYQTHYTQNGYNITYGGDDNPMDDINVINKHKSIMKKTAYKHVNDWKHREFTEEYRQNLSKAMRNRMLRDGDEAIKGLINYNNSRKIAVAMLDKDDNIIKIFPSISDACKYLGLTPKKYAGSIIFALDKYKKNGQRRKCQGYSWVRYQGVSTISQKESTTGDGLQSETV